jgi:AcrR family transcriptional regulator
MPTTSTERSVRERILTAAGQLFYQRGYHAVGVDTIIAESGVAKMSLYRHFPSKNALIAAYLERANAQVLALLDEAAGSELEPLARLRAIIARVAQIATGPQCLGCAFQMSAAEFPERDHPAHQVAVAHKLAVRERLLALAQQASLRDPEVLADQLLLLIDGTWIAARSSAPKAPPPRSSARPTR